jgi:hypothetical protein
MSRSATVVFDTAEAALRLFDRHLVGHGVAHLIDVTPMVIETFLTSNRASARAAIIICSASCGAYLIGWSIKGSLTSRCSGCNRAE